MFKDNDMIPVYSEYEHTTFMPTQTRNGMDYIVEGSYVPTMVTWADVKYINRISTVFKTGRLRFGEEFEQEVLKQLRIDSESNFYPKWKIEEMLLNPTDEVFEEIIKLRDLNIVNDFLSLLIYFQNSNEYNLSEKLGLYIRARKEELEKGVSKSELTYTPNKMAEKEVVEPTIAKAVTTPKPKSGNTRGRKTTSK